MDQLLEEDGTTATFSSTFMNELEDDGEDDLIGLDLFDLYDYGAFDGIEELAPPEDVIVESIYTFENFMIE